MNDNKDIIINNVSKSFDGKKVLCNFSAVIPHGETTCIKGPSGCGKTTLLGIIAASLSPDSGTLENVPESKSFVFQEDRLCEDFTAVGNVRFVTGKKLKREEIIEHLAQLGLGDELTKPVREFSGGMKRRVAIARAICADADLVLLDEPFKGLDDAMRYTVMDHVRAYTAGKTVICVTHSDVEAKYLGGNVITLGTATE